MTRSLTRIGAILVLTVPSVIGATVGFGGVAAAQVCESGVAGDVNGDGHAEVAVGEPGDNGFAGAVHLFYGTQVGVVTNTSGDALDDQLFTQDSPGVPDRSENNDAFGLSTQLADFDEDGCADLAIGAFGENSQRGAVTVLFGSPTGLTTTGVQRFTEASLFGEGSGLPSEGFGSDLSSGDFDDDGAADLVVGAPGEEVDPGVGNQGAMAVLYGSADGLNEGRPSTLITQDSPAVPGAPESADIFGESSAAADFDGDGVDDLAVGVPGETNARGIVQVLAGAAGEGVGNVRGRSFNQDTPGVPGTSEPNDQFGAAVAAGDVDGDADGTADLAVGTPGENEFRGAVSLLLGSSSGVSGAGSQHWTQNSAGVFGVAEPNDAFGSSLVAARLDGGRLADLAIGIGNDDVGPINNAGAVNFLLGRRTGLGTQGSGGSRFHQDTDGIGGAAEPGDRFGFVVDAGLVQTPDQDSLLVGAPFDDVTGVGDAGVFHQLATNEFGPNPFGSRTLDLNSTGVKGTPETDSQFGQELN